MQKFPENWKNLNTVLCHDWLTGMRGGERVLKVLCEGFPKAPLFTLLHDPTRVSGIINSHNITTSFLQSFPGIIKNYRYMLPFFPFAIESMKTPPADLLISTSHCVAKGLKQQAGTKHICYCFTPMRYAWTFYDEYFGKSSLKSAAAAMLLPFLRRWDRNSSTRVDRFIAISKHVQKRIKDFYGRDSDIVYPPVDTDRLTPSAKPDQPGTFDLIVSAIVPYKRIDLAVDAYTEYGYPLKIVGIGSELEKLRARSGSNIEFLEWKPDHEILELYRSCRMLVFPGEEDFGIVPLEAQSCGKPVVAYGKGGALETIKEGVTGVFFGEQTEKALIEAVKQCSLIKWDSQAIRANAERFSIANFITGFSESINNCLGA